MEAIKRLPGHRHWFTLIREAGPYTEKSNRKILRVGHDRTINIIELKREDARDYPHFVEPEDVVALSLSQWRGPLPIIRSRYLAWVHQTDYLTLRHHGLPDANKWGYPSSIFLERSDMINLHRYAQAWLDQTDTTIVVRGDIPYHDRDGRVKVIEDVPELDAVHTFLRILYRYE